MAERRMFSKKITDDDHFLSLSSGSQALFLHLTMGADDDGFNNQVSLAMFKAHASTSDLQALIDAKYVYQFNSGVIVLKHWRMANSLRKDRYTPTAFTEERAQLLLKDNGAYTWLPDGCQTVAEWLPDGCRSIDKNSVDKNILDHHQNSVSLIDRLTDDEFSELSSHVVSVGWGDFLARLDSVDALSIERPLSYCLAVAKDIGVYKP